MQSDIKLPVEKNKTDPFCLIMTPFGFPEVPEVYIIILIVSGVGPSGFVFLEFLPISYISSHSIILVFG